MHLSPTPPRRTAAIGGPAAGTSPALAEPAAHVRPIRVMSYNIHHGRGVDGRLDLARISAEIRGSGADIIGLQEVDRHWSERSNFADQAAELARELAMRVVYGANLDLAPLHPGEPRRQYGNAILSAAPIRGWRNILLPRTGNLEQRGLLEALVIVRSVPVRVFSTHLQHNSRPERMAQIAAIREVVGMVREPVVLVGDLNARPGTPEIAAITEDLVDAWAQVGVGPGYTYPTDNPRARLDYVLHSNDVVTCAAAVLSADGSDHLPVVADLALPRRPGRAGILVRLLRRLIRPLSVTGWPLPHGRRRESARWPSGRTTGPWPLGGTRACAEARESTSRGVRKPWRCRMSPSEIQRRGHELVNSRNLDGLYEVMRADVDYEVVPQGRTLKGVDEVQAFLQEWFSAISDIRIRTEEGTYLEGPGFSVAMIRGGGRNDGAFGSIPATGREVDFAAWEVVRIDGEGKVASAALLYDQMDLLAQLGQVPQPG